jgi:hypothetical protein
VSQEASRKPFKYLKDLLASTPAPRIPDLNRQSVACLFLIQKLDEIPRPVAYFSKQLGSIASKYMLL